MLILKKMPRTQLSNIRKFFIYKISTDSSVCQIDDCGTIAVPAQKILGGQ